MYLCNGGGKLLLMNCTTLVHRRLAFERDTECVCLGVRGGGKVLNAKVSTSNDCTNNCTQSVM